MKTVTVLFVLACGTTCMAQKVGSKNVPAAAQETLQKNFGVTKAKWDKEGENYEANFTQKGKEMSVVVSAAGALLETETEISQGELPTAAQASLRNDYAGFKIEEVARITAAGVVTFEAEIEKGEQTFELIFDNEGKILKKEEKKEEEKIRTDLFSIRKPFLLRSRIPPESLASIATHKLIEIRSAYEWQ